MPTIDDLNAADGERFVALLDGVFEHSPWVAEAAWAARPFAGVDALHEAMMAAVRAAPRERRLALARAHPELAGREAAAGDLTAASTAEQRRLGFDALARSELERIGRLNRSYRERFGFPCIVALARHRTRGTVLAEMERRLGNDPETELANAVEAIGHIARARLERRLAGG